MSCFVNDAIAIGSNVELISDGKRVGESRERCRLHPNAIVPKFKRIRLHFFGKSSHPNNTLFKHDGHEVDVQGLVITLSKLSLDFDAGGDI